MIINNCRIQLGVYKEEVGQFITIDATVNDKWKEINIPIDDEQKEMINNFIEFLNDKTQ